MKKLGSAFVSVFVVSLFSAAAYADCVATCSDSDAGYDPAHAGTLQLSTTCSDDSSAAPTVELFPDQCSGSDTLLEYSCKNDGATASVVVSRVNCATPCMDIPGLGGQCTEVVAQPTCPVHTCPALPTGCYYSAPSVENGCPTGCGRILCDNPGNGGNNGGSNGGSNGGTNSSPNNGGNNGSNQGPSNGSNNGSNHGSNGKVPPPPAPAPIPGKKPGKG